MGPNLPSPPAHVAAPPGRDLATGRATKSQDSPISSSNRCRNSRRRRGAYLCPACVVGPKDALSKGESPLVSFQGEVAAGGARATTKPPIGCRLKPG